MDASSTLATTIPVLANPFTSSCDLPIVPAHLSKGSAIALVLSPMVSGICIQNNPPLHSVS
jgi:hypothetical protein